MLERPALRLLPWTRATSADLPGLAANSWVRRVTDAAGGALGFVQLARGPSWFGLGPERLDVLETEDASLLMSLEQGWFAFGHWQVLDAEKRLVGSVLGAHLLDDRRSRFATLWHDATGSISMRENSGRTLARLQHVGDGALALHFATDLEPNPFVRMILLAAALVQGSRPRT